MNIAQIFLTNLFSTVAGIWWVIPILLIVLLLKSPRVKGMLGEKMVQTRAALKLDRKIYRPFHNLILPSNGATTQLDHVYVSPYGIFVVETKNWTGWIFGGENQANWRQVIYHKKTHFQNPFR
nr:nuclease-related domain-containing protein [uncultured Kingella sp.]